MGAFVTVWQRAEEKRVAGCVTVDSAPRCLQRFTLGEKLDNLPLAAS